MKPENLIQKGAKLYEQYQHREPCSSRGGALPCTVRTGAKVCYYCGKERLAEAAERAAFDIEADQALDETMKRARITARYWPWSKD